jgi:methyl-accepting chemotaxis protein
MNIAERLKLNIRGRMLLYILTSATLVYAVSISYLSIRSANQSIEYAKTIAISNSSDYARQIKGELDGIFQVTRSIASNGAAFYLSDWKTFMPIFLETQKNIIEQNKGFLSVATSWEKRFIDVNYKLDYGRFLNGYYRKDGVVTYFETNRNMDGDDKNSNYYKMKTTKKEMLVDPHYYSYSGKADENIMNANFSTPILYKNQYIGLAGIDVDLGHFQQICKNIQSFESSYAFILSNNGTWVSSPITEYLGKQITETDEEFATKHTLIEKIQEGKSFTLIDNDSLGQQIFYAFTPIISIGDPRPWTFAIAVPLDIVYAPARKFMRFAIFLGLLGFLVMAAIIYYISHSITRPIKQTTRLIQKLSLGNIEFERITDHERSDEIGEMERSIETLSNGLLEALRFAKEIGSGNLKATFTKLSEQDVLGQTLLDMRQSLQDTANELAKKQEDDRIQRWSTENNGKLMDIIRRSSESVKKMGYEVISFIIDQVGACQGAMYILRDNDASDIYYELVSAVAYDRKKLIHSKIRPEEGLVGRCAFEKLTIVLTDIPENYVTISSGLGDSNPNCIILIPLVANDQVLGVLELVSFNKFKPYEIAFLEKASETIASTINSIKITQRTAVLLRQSQEQAEVLSQQEEEMRQNIEEMHATQEEAQKRENDMRGLIDAINTVSMIALYDMDGSLIDINPKFCNMLGVSKEQLLGRKQGSFSTKKQAREMFDNLWMELRNGNSKQITQEIEINGKMMWITELYAPVLDTYGEPVKVYNIAIDITQSMKKR